LQHMINWLNMQSKPCTNPQLVFGRIQKLSFPPLSQGAVKKSRKPFNYRRMKVGDSERGRKNGERQSTVQVPGVFLACPEAGSHGGCSGLELQLKWEPNVCVRLSSVRVHCLFFEAAGMSPPAARLFCGQLENPRGPAFTSQLSPLHRAEGMFLHII